jgi:hypothetical protein
MLVSLVRAPTLLDDQRLTAICCGPDVDSLFPIDSRRILLLIRPTRAMDVVTAAICRAEKGETKMTTENAETPESGLVAPAQSPSDIADAADELSDRFLVQLPTHL